MVHGHFIMYLSSIEIHIAIILKYFRHVFEYVRIVQSRIRVILVPVTRKKSITLKIYFLLVILFFNFIH